MLKLNSFSVITTLLLLIVTISACDSDQQTDPKEEINNQLDGEWNVSTFKIHGDEQIGDEFSEIRFDFNKTGPIQGRSEWVFEEGISPRRIWTYTYEIQSDGTQIELTFDEDGFIFDFEVDINSDELEMIMILGGQAWEVKATRD